MVKFLNQKEEVIRLELTPYGKEKFSKGELKPEYYAFYDNDILYDGVYGGLSESQNNIVTRISTQTPRFGPLVRFTGSVSPIVSMRSLNLANSFNQQAEYTAPFNRYLGDSSPWSDYVPSWHITINRYSDVALSGTTNFRAGNTIPVVSASLVIGYDISALPGTEDNPRTFYRLSENQNITLDVQEMNTLFKLNGNYDVEIFKVDDSSQITALGFINPNTENADNLFFQAEAGVLATTIEGTDDDILQAYPSLDNSYVEYFLEVLVDQEVPGVEMPTHSTVYRRNIEREPGNICDIVDSIGTAEDWGY